MVRRFKEWLDKPTLYEVHMEKLYAENLAALKQREEEERLKTPEQRVQDLQQTFREERRLLRDDATRNLVLGLMVGAFVMLFLAAIELGRLPGVSAAVFFGTSILIFWLRGFWELISDWRSGKLKSHK
jgi:hypothetical protein